MSGEFEVEGFLGSTDKVVFFLDASEFTFEDGDGVHGCVGAHAALYGAGLFPFLEYIVDFVLYDFVFCDNLELQSGCHQVSQSVR